MKSKHINLFIKCIQNNFEMYQGERHFMWETCILSDIQINNSTADTLNVIYRYYMFSEMFFKDVTYCQMSTEWSNILVTNNILLAVFAILEGNWEKWVLCSLTLQKGIKQL